MSLFQDFLQRLLISKISFLPRSLLCHPDIFRREVQGRGGLAVGERKKGGQRKLLMNQNALATAVRTRAPPAPNYCLWRTW